MDAFLVDHGTNLENMEGITRAITRRVSERRRDEAARSRDDATQKDDARHKEDDPAQPVEAEQIPVAALASHVGPSRQGSAP